MFVFLYMAALFIALSPGVLVRFPKNCSKLVVAATHGTAFVAIFWLTHKFVWTLGRRMGYEGFQNVTTMPPPASAAQAVATQAAATQAAATQAATANAAAINAATLPDAKAKLDMANKMAKAASGSSPEGMPAAPIQSSSGSSNLAAMNIMISTGSGASGNPCKNGNDCASGMCMAAKCM